MVHAIHDPFLRGDCFGEFWGDLHGLTIIMSKVVL